MSKETIPKNRGQWRAWLRKNHAKEKEVFVVYYKKQTGKPSITYTESLEEALCYGWIDGKKQRRDDETYTHRFSPRKAKSKWSPTNLKLAKKLIANGKMTKAGLKAYEQRTEYDSKAVTTRQQTNATLPAELASKIEKNKKAWKFFNAITPAQRKQYVLWLTSAKKPETREKRLREAISLLANNEKLGMK